MTTHSDWTIPAGELRARLGPVTEDQLSLASQTGLKLDASTPALLAGALLRQHLAESLVIRRRPPSDDQLEYLTDLAGDLDEAPPQVESREEASAYIEILTARRALRALETLRPRKGDIVAQRPWRGDPPRRSKPPDSELRIVSNVGHDGRLHFRGGGGRRSEAHRVEIVYRIEDFYASAVRARQAATAEARDHSDALRSIDGLSSARWRRLARWSVPSRLIWPSEVDRLLGVVDTASDEKPIQLFLQQNPHLLAASSSAKTWPYVEAYGRRMSSLGGYLDDGHPFADEQRAEAVPQVVGG